MSNNRSSRWELSRLSLWLMACFMALSISCGTSLPHGHVGPMEANHPWMIFDPTEEQGMVAPCGDRQDPDILYLVFILVGERCGDAVKINLRTKEVSPYHFNVAKWQDVDNSTIRYKPGYRYKSPDGPLWIEFRGKKEERIVKHLYGDPIPVRPGTRKASLRSGYYYIMDKQGDSPLELLRVKIVNSELNWAGLGSTYISPDGKWLVFKLDNDPSRTFIFNRKETIPATFQTDHEDQVLEVWKEWGAKMGEKP